MTEPVPDVINLGDVLPDPPDIPAPPKREEPEPEAPKRRGRPPKDVRARTTNNAPDPKDAKKAKAAAALTPKDFTADLTALTDGVWLAASQVGVAAPYAAILKANQPGLVSALNQAANQNSTVRNYVEKLAGGGNASWMLSLGMVATSMALQAVQVSKDEALRAQVVESNAAAVKSYLEQVSGQLEQMKQQQES